MKVVILGGAAHMAQPTIKYLVKQDYVKTIKLIDLNEAGLEEIKRNYPGKIVFENVNIMNKEALTQAIKGADLLMNFVGPYFQFGTHSLETAIDAGVNYIDICDDYDVTQASLALTDKAKENDVLAITGMGASPGLTNLLARLGANALDETDEINTHWVVGESGPSGFGVLKHMFHIIDGKIPTFIDGEVKEVEAFSPETSKTIKFDDPIGEITLYHVGHPEPVTLPQFIPGVKTVTNYGALIPDAQNNLFKLFVDLGLTSRDPIKFEDTEIAPLDFLLHFLQAKQGSGKKRELKESVSATQIEVIGKKDGVEAIYTFSKSGGGGMAEGTSIPTAVAASLILQGKVTETGVMAPEMLDPLEMIEALAKVGYFTEDEDGFKVKREHKGELVEGSLLDRERFSELYQ